MTYLSKVMNTPTPQSEPLRGDQVKNSAGGYAWAVDDWTRLERFLILGSEGGSYYAGEHKLTLENAEAVKRCVEKDGQKTLLTITAISRTGRAPKNSQALFALAMLLTYGSEKDKQAVRTFLPLIARTASHLFEFVSYVTSMRGWGRSLRNAVAGWYEINRSPMLAYQGIKYRNRNGWTHADLLRSAHPKAAPGDEVRNAIFKWMVDGWENVGPEPHPDEVLRTIWAYETAQITKDKKRLISLITDYNLPREAIPTEWLNDVDVWAALLNRMPLTALIRNLGKMTSVGLLTPLSVYAKQVQDKLGNAEHLKKSRVHPLGILVALNTYAQGKGVKGSLTWTPVQPIVDALNGAFYTAFGNVPVTGKRWMLALDVSGSMGSPDIAGMPGISPRVGSGAMSLITAAVEPQTYTVGFTSKSRWGGNEELTPLNITPRMRLDQVIKNISGLPFGGTDCALPMLHAIERKLEVDAFVVYTDSETWAGDVHPSKALQEYRQKTGINAKLIVVGMVANQFSIADPNDAGMLDVVGFDTASPAVMADFVSGGATATAVVPEAEEQDA